MEKINSIVADAILEVLGIEATPEDMEQQSNISEVNPNPDHDRMPDPFESPIKGFVLSRSEVEDYIRKHLETAMKETGMGLRDMAVRGGVDGGRKYIEAVFEYDDLGRPIYEDDVLKYVDKYHPMAIEGARVSFHPINDKQTGSLEDFLRNASAARDDEERHLKSETAGASAKSLSQQDDDIPEPPPPKSSDPNDTHNLDYQSKIEVDIYQDNADPDSAQRSTGAGKGVPFSKDEISQLAAAIGTTTNLAEGGWILPDGRLLKFMRDGVRRKEQDIGIGFTEERKRRIFEDAKKARGADDATSQKKETTGPYDINGLAQSQPVDPWGSIAERSFPEKFPIEAIRGGLVRYGLSPDGEVIEIEVYNNPTQGQMDVLEDIHEWVKFVNEGGYEKKEDQPAPTVETGEELTYAQPSQEGSSPPQQPQAQPTTQDAMVDEDGYEADRREKQEEAEKQEASGSPAPELRGEPTDTGAKSRLIIVYVGGGDDDWWDYDSAEEVERNIVKDLRTYWREGKKPNEDFLLPDEDDTAQNEAHPQQSQPVAADETIGWLKARNADIFPKRNYRPRTTLLKQVDYETARRIIRENVALIKTIPLLDILKTEQKILGYFRKKVTRDQLARYFYKAGDGAITKAWSEVIADDQINKAAERLRIAKWKKNGVSMVRWVHCGLDEPRPYHKEKWDGGSGIFTGVPNGLNGYVFPIDFPPVIDLHTGERGYPGQMVNCRCHLEPVT